MANQGFLHHPFFVPFAALEPIISNTDLYMRLFVFSVGDDDDAVKVSLVDVVVSVGIDMFQSSF